jgi:hypothetical protein
LSPTAYPGLSERWWLYWRSRAEMWKTVATLDRVLVIARHSKTALPQFVKAAQVMSEATVIFATDRSASLALLSSSQHYWWAIANGSSIKGDLRYTPSDIYDKLAIPALTGLMDQAGDELDAFRRGVMEERKVGLTSLYDLVHSEGVRDNDIVQLREIHIDIDNAVREAYALDEDCDHAICDYEQRKASAPLPMWREIELGHGFHETQQGMRFTISPKARVDVLDKLLALNHYRYEQEVKQGLHSGKGRGPSRKKGTRRTPSTAAPGLDDGGLFPPAGTLF